MAVGVGVQVGRARVIGATRFVSPNSNTYIRSMKAQMDEIARRLSMVANHVEGVTAQAMYHAVKPIMDLSQEYVPEDTGALKRSAFREIRKGVNGPRLVIGYAKGGSPSYAAFVHEMLHIPHAKGKSAKFLERAVNERMHVFKRSLFEYIRDNSGLRQEY